MRVFDGPVNLANKLVLHDVHIVDGSGSMSGVKFSSAVDGVNKSANASKQSSIKEGISATLSVYQFGTTFEKDGNGNFTKMSIKDFNTYSPRFINGATRLYCTVGDILVWFRDNKEKDERVLVTIFTDGQDNVGDGDHPYRRPSALASLIQDLEKNHNFTITFMGTSEDVAYITRNLSIDKSNTIVHDNTAKGIDKVYSARAKGTESYMASFSKGLNVTRDFFAGD